MGRCDFTEPKNLAEQAVLGALGAGVAEEHPRQRVRAFRCFEVDFLSLRINVDSGNERSAVC